MLMVDERGEQLYYPIAAGENSESLKDLRIPMGEGIAGYVALTGTTLIVPDVSLDPSGAPSPAPIPSSASSPSPASPSVPATRPSASSSSSTASST